MPEMILNRNKRFISTQGNSVAFKKGEPTFVHPQIVNEVLAFGAEYVNAEDKEEAGKVAEVDERIKVIPTGDERKQLIIEAMQAMIVANDPETFTGSGMPKAPVVSSMVGFQIDATERNIVWEEVIEVSED